MPEPTPAKLALLLDPVYRAHDTGPGHPESPGRYDAVTKALTPFVKTTRPVARRAATEEELALCHSRKYIALAQEDIAAGRDHLSTGDTSVGKATWKVALDAVGGVLNAVDAVMNGQARSAFCAVRPPGHHATPSRGMGFCVFNNVAIAARYARKVHGVERVLIADWDVHHGNGTQDVFYRDASVFFFSTHQHPWYPGTGMHNERGEGKGEGTTLNYPFPAGSGKDEIVAVFQQELIRAADHFKPDLVLVSAGFDSRAGDPLGRFQLTDSDFRALTRVMLDIAAKHAGGRLVSLLEGGYSLSGLAAGVAAHVTELAL
ncbi:MAG: histone deacetylase [Bryobacteraceae bacterium]